MTWLIRHLQALLGALGRMVRQPLATLLTVLVIALALALPAGLWVVVSNAAAATGGIAEADPTRPTVYRLLSFTRFHDQVLLQLNYAIWFPERPADGYFDLLGGHLDGLIWRVTLDREGRPTTDAAAARPAETAGLKWPPEIGPKA